MSSRNYWLDLFTGATWQQFLDAGGSVLRFGEGQWRTVQRMQPGDYLLCYMTDISRWIAVLERTSDHYDDSRPIWKAGVFPCRVGVRPVVTLMAETAVPIMELRAQLSIFKNATSRNALTGQFLDRPSMCKQSDGEAVHHAIREARENPVVRPVDEDKLKRRLPLLKTKIRLVPTKVVEERPEELESIIDRVLSNEGLSVDDPVRIYVREICHTPSLKSRDERLLAEKMILGHKATAKLTLLRQGVEPGKPLPNGNEEHEERVRKCLVIEWAGRRAKEMLLQGNVRLMVSIARRYMGRGLSLLDLLQEGSIGLMKAADKFDHNRAFTFSIYAKWWIRQAITRALSDQSRTI